MSRKHRLGKILGATEQLQTGAKTAVKFVNNAIDRRLRPERLIVSDLTPHKVIYHDGLVSVRHYAPLLDSQIQVESQVLDVSSQKKRVPVLLVPPLGVSAWIFDILQTRSLVKYLLAQGLDVYLIDWGQPDKSHAHLSLKNYVSEWLPAAVSEVRGYSRQQDISLVGYCLGGLLTLLYVGASGDKHVKNLVTIASPIDFHQSGVIGKLMAYVSQPLNQIGRLLNRSLADVSPQKFHVKGARLSQYFQLFNPLGNFTSYLDLLVNMADREYVSTHTTMSRWFNEMLDYPGAAMQNIFVNMWMNNQMARKGYFRLGSLKSELKNITCPVLALAGDTDKIVSKAAAKKILDVVGSEDKCFAVVPGGHAGVFAGARAPFHTWALITTWLDKRSD